VQVRQLGALHEIEIAARRTQLIVEVMNGQIVLLADIAMLRLSENPRFILRRFLAIRIRRRVEGLAPKLANARGVDHLLVNSNTRRLPLAHAGFDQPPPGAVIGLGDAARGMKKPLLLFRAYLGQLSAIAIERFEQLGGDEHTLIEGKVLVGFCHPVLVNNVRANVIYPSRKSILTRRREGREATLPSFASSRLRVSVGLTQD